MFDNLICSRATCQKLVLVRRSQADLCPKGLDNYLSHKVHVGYLRKLFDILVHDLRGESEHVEVSTRFRHFQCQSEWKEPKKFFSFWSNDFILHVFTRFAQNPKHRK